MLGRRTFFGALPACVYFDRSRMQNESAPTWWMLIVESAMDPIIAVDEARRSVARAKRSAAARHRRFGDGCDHYRRRKPAHRDVQCRRRADVRLATKRGDRRAACNVHSAAVPRSAFRTRAPVRRDRRKLKADGSAARVKGIHRNVDEFPIDASISQHTDGAAKFFTVILRDVTERVAAEQALLRSKEELKVL